MNLESHSAHIVGDGTREFGKPVVGLWFFGLPILIYHAPSFFVVLKSERALETPYPSRGSYRYTLATRSNMKSRRKCLVSHVATRQTKSPTPVSNPRQSYQQLLLSHRVQLHHQLHQDQDNHHHPRRPLHPLFAVSTVIRFDSERKPVWYTFGVDLVH